MTDSPLSNREKLQAKLRELFQFESSDLDFGIYRILNHKHEDIERFIEEDLLDAVGKALDEMTGDKRADLEGELRKARTKIEDALPADAIDQHGELAEEYHGFPVAEDYLELQAKLDAVKVAEVTEARIYSDLLKFFSRYYDKGDFCTLRRYSSRDHKYMVPYDGEEVMLHWANKDQYYIKTGERFTDYKFDAGEQKVWFKLAFADTPDDNNKSNGRYFIVPGDDCIDYDADERLLTVRFAYRQLTDEEQDGYLDRYKALSGDKRKTIDRSMLNEVTEQQIVDALDSPNIKGRLLADHPTSKAGRSVLGHHLNRYTASNTHDYFIHKDLGGFLRRELDFFLKNEVLQVDNFLLDGGGEKAYERELLRARAVRRIAERIIQFLAQIEDFQKRLFEKKKFVTETNWCVTLDRVPEELYPAILDNKAQLERWFELYAIDQWEEGLKSVDELVEQGESFLQEYSSMMIDTGLFERDVREQVLGLVDDLEKDCDGLVLQAENLQALELIGATFSERVEVLYIDPPYNTGNDGFIYKDRYQHSSWLSMLRDRLERGRALLSHTGTATLSIDDAELHRIRELLDEVFGPNELAKLIWDRNRKNDARFFSVGHEYMLVYAKNYDHLRSSGVSFREPKPGIAEAEAYFGRLCEQYGDDWDSIRREWLAWFEDIPKSDPRRRLARFSKVGPRGPYRDDGDVSWPGGGGPRYEVLHPKTGKPCRVPARGWMYPTPERFWEEVETGRVVFGPDETTSPGVARYLFEDEGQVMPSVFYSYAQTASQQFDSLFGFRAFDNPKHWPDIARIARYLGGERSYVLDYFAGSGTTAHAVIDLNREDGGDRKYILVEMGEYFDTVLMPRIQKVVFAEEWKDGVPQFGEDGASGGVSHMFKYQRLESYEDALNNIELEPLDVEQHQLPNDYMLGYMLDMESRESPSLLNRDAFTKPFEYRLKIQRGEVTPRPTVVDLQETFHYLIGMRVEKMEVHEHQGREYRVSRGQVPGPSGLESAVVVWRNLEPELDYEQEQDWAREELLEEPVDRVYVNGPSGITGYDRIEHVFRAKMDPAYGGKA